VFIDSDPTPYEAHKIKVLSIKTIYADQIRDRTKLWELRTYNPKIPDNRWLALYESAPKQSIESIIKVGRTFKMPPEEAWHKLGHTFGIEADDYFLYYRKRDWAFGLEVLDVKNIEPLKLHKLREECGFAVPQMCMFFRSPPESVRQAITDCSWNTSIAKCDPSSTN